MTAIFGSDRDKALAVELRRLLTRLQSGEGADRKLGADIRDVFALSHTIGDPTGCLDCALSLAGFLQFNKLEVAAWAAAKLRDRVRAGWKAADAVTNEDIARAVTCCALKGQIARLERAPA